MTDVMISYSRRDSDFVRRLYQSLEERGQKVWVDWQDIPFTADWWAEIAGAIEAADTFIFVISPDSMGSPICNLEIDHARANNKRLVPILYRKTDLDEALERVSERPPSDNTKAVLDGRDMEEVVRANWNAVSRHNWLYIEDATFNDDVQRLLDALELDLEHVRQHTRLLVRAAEWERRNHSASFLLTGEAVSEAEEWLTQGVSKTPAPTALHADYINASRRALEARQRRLLAGVSIALVVSLVLAVVAGFLAVYANGQRTIAEENAITATVAQGEAVIQANIAATRAAEANSLLWSSYAEQVLESGDSPLALVLALSAAGLEAPPALAQRILAEVAYAPGPQSRYGEPIIAGEAQVNAVAVNAEGTLAALGLFDQRVLLLNLDTMQPVNTFTGHALSVQDVTFSPDGHYVLSVAFNQLIQFDVETLDTIHQMTQPNGAVINAVAVSHNGRQALTGALDGTVTLWDLDSGEPLEIIEAHTGAVNAVAFGPNSQQFISGAADDQLKVWTTNGELVQNFRTSSDVTSVAFNRDGHTLLAGTQLGEVLSWSLERPNDTHMFGESGAIRHLGQTINAVTFSPNGLLAASAGDDQRVIVWDVASAEALHVFDAHDAAVNDLAFTPDGRGLLSGSADSTVYVWRVIQDDVTHEFVVGGHNAPVSAADYSTDGNYLAMGDEDGVLIAWNTATGRAATRYINTPGAHLDAIQAIAFLPDSTQFLTGSADTTLVLWDATNNRDNLGRFEGHTDRVTAVTVNADGTRALSGSSAGELFLWDITSGEQLQAMSAGEDAPAHRRDVTQVLFVDDTRAVSASQDRTAALWDITNGEPLQTYEHGARVLGIGLSPDGQSVYTAGNDDLVIVWDIASGEEQGRFFIGNEGQERSVAQVAFHREASTVLVGYVDGSAVLWDLQRQRPIASYGRNQAVDSSRHQVTALAVRPDATSALVAGRNLAAFEVRTLPLPVLVDWTRANRFIREVTCTERQTYNLPPFCEDEIAATDEG